MKKTSFYSYMVKDRKKQAVLHHGYSDGTYYYYKDNGGVWQVIHPLVGLSVTYGYTRKEAAAKAHVPELENKVDRVIKERGAAMTKEFEKAIQELKQSA